MKIFKYRLTGEYVAIPNGFKILDFGIQKAESGWSEDIVMWAEVDPIQKNVPLVFQIKMTGSEAPRNMTYRKTLQFSNGIVAHVYTK